MAAVPGGTISELVRRLLDREYRRTAERVLVTISHSVTNGVIARRLNDFEAEAARLAEQGQRLNVDNSVLRALTADLDEVMRRNARLVSDSASTIQLQAVDAAARLTREFALPGLSDAQLAAIGLTWNVPDPEAVNTLVQFADSAGWQAELERFAGNAANAVNNVALRGIVEGWGPRRTARAIRQAAEGIGPWDANNLMRTLQLQSYRTASAIHQTANIDMLEVQIRIATLDDRTCMACIALHGTEVPVGERIDDHWSGRCTSITQVKGRPRYAIQSGDEWFNRLPAPGDCRGGEFQCAGGGRGDAAGFCAYAPGRDVRADGDAGQPERDSGGRGATVLREESVIPTPCPSPLHREGRKQAQRDW